MRGCAWACCRVSGGELFERVIDDEFILTEKVCTIFMRQICEGVEFMHTKSVIHLDMVWRFFSSWHEIHT